jgi:thiol peroxidase
MATTMLKGNIVNLAGTEINVGDSAPEVTLPKMDLSDTTVGGAKTNVQLLIVVPSLDTPVCATETREFNNKIAGLDNVDTTIISMDLPFASKRFCSTEGIDNLTVTSDFRTKEFGNAYGMLVADGALRGVLARCIFVIGTDGKVTYKQLVPEITTEPNYDEAIEAVEKAS